MKLPSIIQGKIGPSLVCLLAYFVMAGLLTQMGVVKIGIEETFNVTSSEAAMVFSWLLTGVLIGTTVSNFVYKWLQLKAVFLISYVPLTVTIFVISMMDSLEMVRLLMGVAGALIGLGLSNAIVTLSKLYQGKYRAPALVCTDLAFAAAGFSIPLTAASLLSSGLPWFSGYYVVAGVAILCILLTILNKFPSIEPAIKPDTESKTETTDYKIGVEVWVLATAAFLVLFAQNTFSIWSPTYIAENLGGTLMQGGQAIGNYWAMAMPAQLVVVFLLTKVVLTVPRFLALCTPLMVLSTIALYLSPSVDNYLIAASAYGIFGAGAYKTIISYGADFSKNPKALTIMLTAGTVGSMSSPSITSWVNDTFGVDAALMMTPIGLTGVMLCVIGIVLKMHFQNKQNLTIHSEA